MRISELYSPNGPFVGCDLVIVGSGPSMSVFPRSELVGKFCLLLNDSCRYFPELGPIAFANSRNQLDGCSAMIKYRIVKGRLKFETDPTRTDNHVRWDDPEHYVFSYRDPVILDRDRRPCQTGDQWSHLDECSLWREPDFYWNVCRGSVSIFAVQFAISAGVRSITLVGCDCNSLTGTHYTSGKPNEGVVHDYDQYAAGLERLWFEAAKRGIPMTSWTPFLGLGYHERQYDQFSKWLEPQ